MTVETLTVPETTAAGDLRAAGQVRAMTATEIAAMTAELGALPPAPLAMPKQRLEHEGGVLRRILRFAAVRPAARSSQG